MSQESVAVQAAQFWELLQRAQELALSAQSTAIPKAAGQEFSVVDANSAGAAAMKAFAEFAQHPLELAAFQQTIWLDATKAWVEARTGESPAVADKRFRDKTWEEDPISRGLRDTHLAVEKAVDKLLDSLPKGSKDHLSVEFYTRQFLSALSPSNFLALSPPPATDSSKPRAKASWTGSGTYWTIWSAAKAALRSPPTTRRRSLSVATWRLPRARSSARTT